MAANKMAVQWGKC